MSRPDLFINIAGTSETRLFLRPLPDIPDISRMTQDTKAYIARVLPRFVGEAHEEVEIALEVLRADLEFCEVVARRLPRTLIREVENTIRSFEEIVPELRENYGVEDTEALEKIAQELRVWVQEQQRNRPPGGPAPAPI